MEHFEGILDHYAVLELEHDCSAADVRKAFRAKALRWHPDKAGTSAEARRRFQEASDAYEVLGDDEKRKTYDLHLQQAERAEKAEKAKKAEEAERAKRAATSTTPQSSPERPAAQASNPARQDRRSQGYPAQPFPKPSWQAQHRDQRPTYAEVHGHHRPDRPADVHQGFMRETREVREVRGHDPRPTAAELNPQGFGRPFRATVSDLQTLASFSHEGAMWVPKVRDVKWCRPGDGVRIQLSYVADYTSSRSQVSHGSRLLQLLQTSNCDALQTSFQEHLDRVAGRRTGK